MHKRTDMISPHAIKEKMDGKGHEHSGQHHQSSVSQSAVTKCLIEGPQHTHGCGN